MILALYKIGQNPSKIYYFDVFCDSKKIKNYFFCLSCQYDFLL